VIGSLFALLLVTPLLEAAPGDTPERYAVELRVIEGIPGDNATQKVDPRLAAFAKDFKALPFKEIKLKDDQTSVIREGERVSLEIPGGKKGKPRFLKVQAHGRQSGGKLRFQLTVESLKFDTLVAVPDGGTVLVALPKKKDNAVLFAFTATTQKQAN
jgi:hypothetical protein